MGSRLTGILHTFATRSVVVAIAGLLVAAYLLIEVRPLYVKTG